MLVSSVVTVCTANRMFPLFFQLLLLMRERECKYLSSFSLLFIYSINFWWIDVFFRKWKNIISTKVNRQYYGSLETDIICFMEKFVYETGSWTINLECHNGLYKCAVWTLFAKTLSPTVQCLTMLTSMHFQNILFLSPKVIINGWLSGSF